MNHVLKTSHLELERTHTLVEVYRASGIKEIFFSLFGTSFKKALDTYAYKKEEILITYKTLHTDISKDAMHPAAKVVNLGNIRENILHITTSIEECGELLEHLIAHSHRQEEIVHHEKLFFVNLLESFNEDLNIWVGAHEKEVFGSVSETNKTEGSNPLEAGKILLEVQKKRLEEHMDIISNSH